MDQGSGTFVSLLPGKATALDDFEFLGFAGSSGKNVQIGQGSICVGNGTYWAINVPSGDKYINQTTNAPYFEQLSITEDDSYVGWEYNIVSKTLSIKNFGSTFAQEDGYIRQKLYLFGVSKSGNTLYLKRTTFLSGNFPANYGS